MESKKYVDFDKVITTYKTFGHLNLHNALEAFNEIPAVDVQPVVRGKWVNYGDEYHPDIKCCICGQRKPILLGNFNFNFCPNCGADMREIINE